MARKVSVREDSYSQTERHQASGTTQKNKGTEEVVVSRRRPRNPLLQEVFKKSSLHTKNFRRRFAASGI